MTANEVVKLSDMIDFDKDNLNILWKGKSKYKADLTLDKGMDVGTGGTGGMCPQSPIFSHICI